MAKSSGLNGGFLFANYRSNSASSGDFAVEWTLNWTKKNWKKNQEAVMPGRGARVSRLRWLYQRIDHLGCPGALPGSSSTANQRPSRQIPDDVTGSKDDVTVCKDRRLDFACCSFLFSLDWFCVANPFTPSYNFE